MYGDPKMPLDILEHIVARHGGVYSQLAFQDMCDLLLFKLHASRRAPLLERLAPRLHGCVTRLSASRGFRGAALVVTVASAAAAIAHVEVLVRGTSAAHAFAGLTRS